MTDPSTGMVAILTTGGTIAMTKRDSAGGAVPTLSAQDLLSALPDGLPRLRVEELFNLPSAHFTLQHLEAIRTCVLQLLEDRHVIGVVITHGTDTIEETAFYLDLTIPVGAPIVLTGAMRTASEVGYDGYANIADAVRVAAAEDARYRGTLLVANNEIHLARYVTKTHAQALDTFQSPGFGPVGRSDLAGVRFTCPAGHRPTLTDGQLEPAVYLLRVAVGLPPDLLRYTLEIGVRGIVIEAFGAGRVPPDWLEPIQLAVAAGVTVVIATRCHTGYIYDEYGYKAGYRDLKTAGCLFADGLTGPKCRIKLMAILGQAREPAVIKKLWEEV